MEELGVGCSGAHAQATLAQPYGGVVHIAWVHDGRRLDNEMVSRSWLSRKPFEQQTATKRVSQ